MTANVKQSAGSDGTAGPTGRSDDAAAGTGAGPPPAAGRASVAARLFLAVAAALAVLPAITGVPYYLFHLRRYHPWSDHALIELQVREVGRHLVTTGPFSREGWHHPGPAMYYLIAAPYRLLGASSAALPITGLLLNAVCVVAAAYLLRRALGTAAAAAGLVAVVFYLRVAPNGFWRDPWNPYIAVMPLLITVVACLLVVGGERRWLPLAVATGSFSVQCHVGFTLPVAAVLAVTAIALLATPLVRRQGPAAVGRGVRRRGRLLGASAAVFVAMWALPVGQQIFGRRGNLTLIWDYLRTHSPTTSPHDAGRILLSQLGAVPGYVAGQVPHSAFVTFPPVLPAWTGLVSLAFFAVAVVVALRMRHAALLRLAGFTAVVALTVLLAVSRIIGPVFAYLVEWTAIAGILLWTTVGGVAAVALSRALRGSRPVAVGAVTAVGAVALALVTALSALSVRDTARATTPGATSLGTPGDSTDVVPLSQAVRAWLGPAHAHDAVRVDIAPTGGPNLVDPTLLLTPGLVLDLRKHGVRAVVGPDFENAYGSNLVRGFQQAPLRVVVSYGDQSRLPAGAGRLLGRSHDFVVYGGPSPSAAK